MRNKTRSTNSDQFGVPWVYKAVWFFSFHFVSELISMALDKMRTHPTVVKNYA